MRDFINNPFFLGDRGTRLFVFSFFTARGGAGKIPPPPARLEDDTAILAERLYNFNCCREPGYFAFSYEAVPADAAGSRIDIKLFRLQGCGEVYFARALIV
ncbi:MAG: hypothetical protein J6S27_05185, partial [Thermoguttaceae bacterium]|nr:hypothetical protein [Thermoguttaceae bacterium]